MLNNKEAITMYYGVIFINDKGIAKFDIFQADSAESLFDDGCIAVFEKKNYASEYGKIVCDMNNK
jgi:hypothetical protein